MRRKLDKLIKPSNMKTTFLTILILICLCIFFNLDAQATLKILYPTSNGNYQNFVPIGGGTHWSEVDDPDGSSDTATYVYKLVSLDQPYYETNALEDCGSIVNGDSVPDCVTIDSLKLHIRCKYIGAGIDGTKQLIWYDGVSFIYQTITITTSYVDFYDTLYTRNGIAAGDLITKSYINALQIGIYMDVGVVQTPIVYMTASDLHVYYSIGMSFVPVADTIKNGMSCKGAGAGSHYLTVDDWNKTTDTLDYIYTTSVGTDYYEHFSLKNATDLLYSAPLIPTGATIDSVRLFMRGKNATADEETFAGGFRVGASYTWGSERAGAWTNYTEKLACPGGRTWNISRVDSLMLCGRKTNNIDAARASISTLRGIVYFTPAAVAGGRGHPIVGDEEDLRGITTGGIVQ